MEIVRKLRSLPGHSFGPDDVSLVGSGDIAPTKILTSGQVTDIYLLALAKARGANWRIRSQAVSSSGYKGQFCLAPDHHE